MEQELKAGDVLKQLRAIAMADVTRVVQVDNGQFTVADTNALPEDIKLAVAGVEKGTGGIKVKFYDKLKALELLGKALGLFEQKPAVKTGGNDLLQAVLESTREVIESSDLPELQQAAAAGDDLVESTPIT